MAGTTSTAQFTFGDGVGRYRGGVTAVPDVNGELQPVGLTALMGGYEHYWSSTLTSNAVFSVTTTPDEPYYSSTFNKELNYGAVNLLYWFLPDRAWAGVEYLYGRREVVEWRRRHRQSHPVRRSFQFPFVEIQEQHMAKSSTAAPRLDHFFSAVAARLDLWRDLARTAQAWASSATSRGDAGLQAAAQRGARPRFCPWRISRPTRAPR